MKKDRTKKIIWALDPYGNSKIQSSAATLARSLSSQNDVEAVYVYGRSGFPGETEQAAIRFDLEQVEKKLSKMLDDFKLPSQAQARILAHGSESVRADVKTLVKYAQKTKAEAILVSTNARTGFFQKVLGSFAETLVLESAIPVMTVNPKAKVSVKPGTILFPTDFSGMSWEAFQHVVNFAKSSKASIQILHQYQGKSQSIPKGVSYYKDNHWLKGEKLLDKELQQVQASLSKWLLWAKKQNVKCEYIIQFGFKNIADATLDLAKKETPWMIAMATITGPVAAAFLGSNARKIVRSAECPVWVLYVEEK